MKFNIANSINVNKLNEEIAKFPMIKSYAPYIFINENTARELFADSIVEYSYENITIKHGNRFGTYQGNKVFIDNTKSYGEVELRW